MNRSVRFPDELVPLVQAEADRLERSFNWVVVKTLERALGAEQHRAPDATPAPPRASRQAPSIRDTWAR